MDGMDQGKFRCPRRREANSKQYSMLFRPQLHCAATWIHGFKILMSISDESSKKDAAAQMEQLARGLDQVYDLHKALPPGLNIQCDNTYREGKNRHCIALYIILVGLSVFRWVTASYLRVGRSSLL